MSRKIVLMLFLIFISNIKNVSGQNQELISKFIITDATLNGDDITPEIIESEMFTVFYMNDDEFYMANVADHGKSMSFGPMYNIRLDDSDETYGAYNADYIYFNWLYINDYDDKKGTARVQLIKIYKPQGTAFILTIIPEDLELIVYKGYMEGTLDFSSF